MQPSWSPHGHRIAYWALPTDSGQRDIWTLPAEGGTPRPVTDDAAVDWNPIWSPDGNYLYFSSDRGGSMNLWRVRIEETTGETLGEPEPMTAGATASRQHLSVSADGRRIAPSMGTSTICARRTVAPHTSPDGEWSRFRSVEPQENLYVIRVDGTDLRQITNDIHRNRRPRWSPDGDLIAFYSDRSGSYEIWTIRPDGRAPTRVTDMAGIATCCPDWSPDGSRLLFLAYHENDTFILRANLAWEEQLVEALAPLNDTGEKLGVSTWSPDGQWLAGSGVKRDDSETGMFMQSVSTGESRKLLDFGYLPQWLNDGRLAFHHAGKVHLLDPSTAEQLEEEPAKAHRYDQQGRC